MLTAPMGSHEMDDLTKVKCERKVEKKLPFCEHFSTIACHQDPAKIDCRSLCGQEMSCCSRRCAAQCHRCMRLSAPGGKPSSNPVSRSIHSPHFCQRLLYCQHPCNLTCSQDHSCNSDCREPCRQECSHHKCDKPCSEPCPPCMDPCEWRCMHQACPVPCGSVSGIFVVFLVANLVQICSRLPCDQPCLQLLKCGHLCPSGEI
jgi:hypothetical protein